MSNSRKENLNKTNIQINQMKILENFCYEFNSVLQVTVAQLATEAVSFLLLWEKHISKRDIDSIFLQTSGKYSPETCPAPR